jgi:hypothetical protein
MKLISKYLTAVVACVALMACNSQQESLAEENAIYYWRTEFRLDSTERAFLKQYNINKVYCRYFDVVMSSADTSATAIPMPNATITFSDTLPSGIELVPTVYITESCMHQQHDGLAEKIVKRVLQMNETNDISGVRELQIDCDYTARSRQVYYDFLKEVYQEWSHFSTPSSPLSPLSSLLSPLLSTTIRLHQLSMAAPPVDYGVLMLYNTGDPQKFDERNPILDIRDVSPYLRHLSGYPLPLAAAYPVFQWSRTIYGVRVEHTADAEEVLRVKKAVERQRPELRRCILTYHLDKENIQRYKPESYEKIYHH